jgi:hypothetical protein
VKVDGRPVASRVPAPKPSYPVTQAPATAPPPPPSHGGYPAPPQAPRPIEAPPTDHGAATDGAWPPPAGDGGRRDTPTEMYVKGVHAAPDEPEEHGDRDTPTRAYELPAQRAPMQETLKSPTGLPGDETDVKTLDFEGKQAMGAPPGALMTMPIPKSTVPLGAVLRVAPGNVSPFAPQGAPTPTPAAPAPSKPAWQASLDRALVWVGRTAEVALRRFRAAPQNTQIIIVIVTVTTALLLLGLVVFLIAR